jgi:hypothetical protein
MVNKMGLMLSEYYLRSVFSLTVRQLIEVMKKDNGLKGLDDSKKK